MRHGRVYWITGLSGSGKTTIGVALYYKLREKYDNVIILDGDILKLFVGEKIGYSETDRLQRAKKYSMICKMLADQGMYVIICTIAMYDEVRLWNRENINGYLEIFLDVPLKVLIARDKKGLYANAEARGGIVGFNSKVEFPKDSDITLKTDGTISVGDCVERIIKLAPRIVGDFDRDSNYWNEYYELRKDNPLKPSEFAKFLLSYIEPNEIQNNNIELLEIGCGNGRDSIFFLEAGIHVTGVDASEYAISDLQRKTSKYESSIFICDDFVKCKTIFQKKYDYVYSRFTLHAINKFQEKELFTNVVGSMKIGGKLFIEARTINDDLYGQGKKISEYEFILDGHYRRFINKEDVVIDLEKLGLEVIYSAEGRGFSKTYDSDPVLMRLIAVRKG